MTLGLGRHLWDVPKTQSAEFGEVICHFPNPYQMTSSLNMRLVAIHQLAFNKTTLADDQDVVLLVIQTNLSTEPGHKMALLRRNICLCRSLYSRIFPRSLHMYPRSERLGTEAAGSLPA